MLEANVTFCILHYYTLLQNNYKSIIGRFSYFSLPRTLLVSYIQWIINYYIPLFGEVKFLIINFEKMQNFWMRKFDNIFSFKYFNKEYNIVHFLNQIVGIIESNFARKIIYFINNSFILVN